MHFCGLRNHEAAQYEIRQYAAAAEDFLAELMPVTHAAFVENDRSRRSRPAASERALQAGATTGPSSSQPDGCLAREHGDDDPAVVALEAVGRVQPDVLGASVLVDDEAAAGDRRARPIFVSQTS